MFCEHVHNHHEDSGSTESLLAVFLQYQFLIRDLKKEYNRAKVCDKTKKNCDLRLDPGMLIENLRYELHARVCILIIIIRYVYEQNRCFVANLLNVCFERLINRRQASRSLSRNSDRKTAGCLVSLSH